MGPDIVPIPSNNVVSQLFGMTYYMNNSTGEVGTMVDGVFVSGRILPWDDMLVEMKRKEAEKSEDISAPQSMENPFSGRKIQT